MLLAANLDKRKSVKTKAGVEGTCAIGFSFSYVLENVVGKGKD